MMRVFLPLTILSVAFAACNKVKIDAPAFDVTANKAEYKVGDSVVFNFSGKADYLVFYSGEAGGRYENKDRTTATGAINQLQFSTTLGSGNQTNNLNILASTNYNGMADSASILGANWTNITSRATFATASLPVSSGVINVSDLQAGDKPLYIAFRYLSITTAVGYVAKAWAVSNFQFTNVFADSSRGIVATDVPTGSFTLVSLKNDSLKWSMGPTTLAFATGRVGQSDDDWAISKPLSLNKVNADAGLALKNTSASMTQYIYTYKKPGTYTATFFASNANINDKKDLVKQVTITVKP